MVDPVFSSLFQTLFGGKPLPYNYLEVQDTYIVNWLVM